LGKHFSSNTSIKQKVQEYYRQAGWDQNGIPTAETLVKLKLDYVDESLKKLRT
jgi:aldehyde:ferredoxin oxidoreductase